MAAYLQMEEKAAIRGPYATRLRSGSEGPGTLPGQTWQSMWRQRLAGYKVVLQIADIEELIVAERHIIWDAGYYVI